MGCWRLVKSCFLVLLIAPSVWAQEFEGLDILGLAMQDAKMIAQEIPHGTSIGVLEGTFGPVIPKLEKLINTDKVPAFRAHLIDGTCWRNHTCQPGSIKPNDYKTMAKRATAFQQLADRHPGVRCFLSPVLEHDVKDKTVVAKWLKILHDNAPNCRIAVSAFTGYVPSGVLVEKHGNLDRSGQAIKADIKSNDGASAFDADMTTYCDTAAVMCLEWVNRCNLRTTGEKVTIPPLKRTAKLGRDDVKQMVRLLRPQAQSAGIPAQCKTVRVPKNREVWKTNAEDYNTQDPRENKPLFISKSQTRRVPILSPTGKEIACIKLYGKYSGDKDHYRSYEGDCSGLSPVELMDKAGSEWLFLREGQNCVSVNAIRRKGYFRSGAD